MQNTPAGYHSLNGMPLTKSSPARIVV
ncbi:uncharacterized protein METZ01_LOCUS372775 [marine metagenome]|uniref:Uncharacterized protein n=1 Tax=marine metagenome TaxID=408172 RepID=A0A382TES7_9ZZZZ